MVDSGSYEEIPEDLMETATKTVRKLVNRMYNEGLINKDLQYMPHTKISEEWEIERESQIT